MPFAVIKQQLEKELGQPIEALFAQFEQSPFAAASIGQVHKAVLPTGEAVVVKVQYPDVDTSIDSDLKHVRLALKITGVLNMDKTLQDKIFAEIRDSLYDELDYSKEAHNLAIFGSFHSDDDGLIIPKVFHSHSTKRILTLSQELGEKLEVAATWDNDIKQKSLLAYLTLVPVNCSNCIACIVTPIQVTLRFALMARSLPMTLVVSNLTVMTKLRYSNALPSTA